MEIMTDMFRDSGPPAGGEMQLRIPELRQLFDPMDPSPRGKKDLSPSVEKFIVAWGREIGGWVAMWRPLEIFLYDWWPVVSDIRLFRRLAKTPVRFVCAGQDG
jgi:hypothetical protein